MVAGRARSGRSRDAAATPRGVDGRLIERIRSRPGGALEESAVVDHLSGKRFVFIDPDPFPRVEHAGLTWFEQMPDFYLPLFIDDERGVGRVLDFDVEDRAANGDHRARRSHRVVIRLAAEMFNLDPDLAQPDIEQVSPVAAIRAEHDAGSRENFELAAIGDLKNAISIRPGNNYLQWLHYIPDVQGPGGVTAHYGDLARESE